MSSPYTLTTARLDKHVKLRPDCLCIANERAPIVAIEFATRRLKGHIVKQPPQALMGHGRVYFDGVFDCLHAGHANALRQARAIAGTLVVGVVSDAEATHAKGSKPIWDETERADAVRAVKFVDEVIESVPYEVNDALIDWLIHKHKIEWIAHGDDVCALPDGSDAYECAKRRNMFTLIRRTEGISTTDIVGRALHGSQQRERAQQLALTSRRLCSFSSARAVEPQSDAVVYVPGVLDAFTPGHARALRTARYHGSYVIAGILPAPDAAALQGAEPLCSTHERALSVLACRYVDDILLDAPLCPDLSSLCIAIVVAIPEEGVTVDKLASRMPSASIEYVADCSGLLFSHSSFSSDDATTVH